MPRDFRCVLWAAAPTHAVRGWSAPIIHTVAPTVWAWGWRRHKFARVSMAIMFISLEPNYFTPLGLDCHFMGHPAAFDIVKKTRKKPSLDAPQIAILPGSRMSEIKHILPIMRSAVALARQVSRAIFTLPACRGFSNTSPRFALTHLSKLLTAIIICGHIGQL